MKKLRLLTGTVFALSLMSFNLLPAAYAISNATSDTTTDTSTDTTKTKTLTAEELAKKQAELKKRLDDNKAGLKTKLDATSTKRITTKCKASIAKIAGAETSAKAVSSNRGKAYSKISEAVQKLIDKLKANGKDTADLESKLLYSKNLSDVLATNMTAYEVTLADLQTVDCTADPSTFQGTLEKARTQREAVKTAATDLRTYISTTLKTAVSSVKSQADDSAEKAGGTR